MCFASFIIVKPLIRPASAFTLIFLPIILGELVKSQKAPLIVIPVKTGIQEN